MKEFISVLIALGFSDIYFLLIDWISKVIVKKNNKDRIRLEQEMGLSLPQIEPDKKLIIVLKVIAGISVIGGILFSIFLGETNVNSSLYLLTKEKIMCGALFFLVIFNFIVIYRKIKKFFHLIKDGDAYINQVKKRD